MKRMVCAAWVLVAALSTSPVLAADKPDMTHLWRLSKTSWPGCVGNATHLMTISQSECNVAKGLGYQGNCNTGNFDAEHYVSSVSFPGSTKVYRLSKGGTCGCKDTYIYTPSNSWKSTFTSQGYNVESQVYYAWPASIEFENEVNDWGLVPVYHAYSSALCDNFYTEHPDQYNAKLGTGQYQCGFETNPNCIAYYAADGWIDLSVQCSVPGCGWTVTGPGGWSVSGSGNYTFPSHSLPSHGYTVTCKNIAGMLNVKPTQDKYFSYFSSNAVTCQYQCDDECSYQGQKQCFGNGYRVCESTAQGCLAWGNTISCDDYDPCTDGDSCVNGTCQPGGPKDCSYLTDACNTGVCAGGGCVAQPKAGACNDGDACTAGDACQNGQCVGTPMDCSYLSDACVDGQCQQGACKAVPKPGMECDDGIACTQDQCDPGAGCSHVPDHALCDDANPCTQDQCLPGQGCAHTNNSGACDDGNGCTVGDACVNGSCSPGTPTVCNDDNPCTDDDCVPATGDCAYVPNTAPCDDGSDCTQNDHCAGGLCQGTAQEGCCATDQDCPNPLPACQTTACVAGTCQTEAFCAEGRCGPNPCDAGMSCGECLAFETCIGGWCRETCDPEDKAMTRCTNDGQTLEKCVEDPAAGTWYWQATDCAALGEAGCAFSQDKNLFVCCTPDCAGKSCGAPSACAIPCGTCAAGEFCCLPGQPCEEPAEIAPFQCLDCCAGIECGPSPYAGCDDQCGTCADTHQCKEGTCVSGCAEAGIDAEGVCTGNVAWWCEESMGKTVLKEVDCAEFLSTCCFDEEQGHVGCCTCDSECEDNGWECGMNTCGEPCGDNEGECAPGFNCVPDTHQCLCQMPELCYPDSDVGTESDLGGPADDASHGLVIPADEGSAGKKSGGCAATPSPSPSTLVLLLLLLLALVPRPYRQR